MGGNEKVSTRGGKEEEAIKEKKESITSKEKTESSDADAHGILLYTENDYF